MKRQITILYILIAIVIAFTVVLVFYGIPGTAPKTAAVILPETTPNDKKDEFHEPEVIEVTTDTVQSVIRSMSRAESYSRSICVESFWSGGSGVRNIDVWVRGDHCKMEISRPDSERVTHVLLKHNDKQLWHSDLNGVFEGSVNDGDADSYQAVLSYERILDLPVEDILEAGHRAFMDEMCIFVRYAAGELGYENVCYVSLTSGLVIGEESYDDGKLVIRVTSTLPDLGEIDDSVFASP